MPKLEPTAVKISTVVGAVLALAALVSGTWTIANRMTGARVLTVTDDFRTHIATEQEWHEEDSVLDSLVRTDTKTLSEHIKHVETKQSTIEGVFFTEQCLENSYEMLARQQLIRVCDSLGIRRVVNDKPPAEAASPPN